MSRLSNSLLCSVPARATVPCAGFSALRRGLSACVPVALAACLLLAAHREARAGAYVSANVAFGEDPAFADVNMGDLHAVIPNKTATDPYTGAKGQIYGAVDFNFDPDVINDEATPFLHASASGQAVQGGLYGAQAGVLTSWTDVLSYKNPQIVNPTFFGTTSVFFVGHFDGNVSGLATGFGGSFSVNVSKIVDGSVVSYSQEIDFTHSGAYNQGFRLSTPATFLFPTVDSDGNQHAASFTLDLSVNGGSQYDGSGNFLGDSSADFSNTAALDTIYIGDSAGNPLPQYADVQVVGNYGAYVMGAPAPEPGTWSLVGVAACVGFLMMRQQRGRALVNSNE